MNSQFYNPSGFKNIYVTSDLHGFHKNIAKGSSNWDDKSGCRDFADQFVMTQYIVKQINSVVQPQDVLLHNGDWSFGGKQNIDLLRSMINCRTVCTIIGNHDEWLLKDDSFHKFFDWVGHYNEFYYHKIKFCQLHYPMASWNEKQRGAIALTGHEHSKFTYETRQLDCCIEHPGKDYKPFHIDEIYDMMMKRPITGGGHHKVGER